MSQFLNKLSPLSDFPWGIVLYTILILMLITLFLQKNAGLDITLLISSVILLSIVDHVATTSGSGDYSGNFFAPFMVRVAMFVFPLVTAGLTKAEKSRPTAILAFVVALGYWILRYTQMPK
ncbi:MAG TPA: hypothetical protein VMT34_00550 [Aggregatilineales bacterium]|nr:hypothetical protein [Aggregatilineales bacterium]